MLDLWIAFIILVLIYTRLDFIISEIKEIKDKLDLPVNEFKNPFYEAIKAVYQDIKSIFTFK